jgi:hypothetical protein
VPAGGAPDTCTTLPVRPPIVIVSAKMLVAPLWHLLTFAEDRVPPAT